MLTALLCAHLLASSTPTATALVVPAQANAIAPAAAVAAAVALPSLGSLLPMSGEEHDPSIKPGLRNMAIGAALGVAGVGLLVTAGGVFFGLALGVGLGMFFLPGLINLWLAAMPVLLAVCSGIGIVGGVLMLLGGLWGGINALLVIQRLSPGYKPGPSNDYLGY